MDNEKSNVRQSSITRDNLISADAHSKGKQTEDRKTFVISNIVSILSSPSKKTDQNEVNAIQDLLHFSSSIAQRQQKTASTKRVNLIAQVKNTAVKWSIKPCIVRTKKLSRH